MKFFYYLLACFVGSVCCMDDDRKDLTHLLSSRYGPLIDACMLDKDRLVVAAYDHLDEKNSLIEFDARVHNDEKTSVIYFEYGFKNIKSLISVDSHSLLSIDFKGNCTQFEYVTQPRPQWKKQNVFSGRVPLVDACVAAFLDAHGKSLLCTIDQNCAVTVSSMGNNTVIYDLNKPVSTACLKTLWPPYLAAAYVVQTDSTKAYIWDDRAGMKERELVGHTDKINDVSFSKDARVLYTSSDDGYVKMWENVTGQLIRNFSLMPDRVAFKQVADNGEVLWAIEAANNVDTDLLFFDPYKSALRARESEYGDMVYISGSGCAMVLDKMTGVPLSYCDMILDYNYNMWHSVVPFLVNNRLILLSSDYQKSVKAPTPLVETKLSEEYIKLICSTFAGGIFKYLQGRQQGRK